MRRKYEYQPEDRYAEAERRVKKLKGFYTHLAVYIVVNSFLFAMSIKDAPANENFFQLKYFSTALFWGLGLVAHAVSVFGQNLFGTAWEEKKIRKLMDKEKRDKWE
jgi:hypothetical protein